MGQFGSVKEQPRDHVSEAYHKTGRASGYRDVDVEHQPLAVLIAHLPLCPTPYGL